MMQAEAEAICTIDDLDGTIIPVELFAGLPTRVRGADATNIVELGKQLLLSAKNGDTEMVRDLMCRGAPFTVDWLGTSALHLAAQNNHLETAEVLLRAGISRDARTKVDRTPLHMAAYEGHHQMAQLLLSYGAEVDSRDMLRMTPLHWAVERQHAEVMLVLLENGADPTSLSKFNKTPISLAFERERLDLVQILQQEREINYVPTEKHSAEIEAATQNLIDIEEEQQKEAIERIEFEEQSQKPQKFTQPSTSRKQKLVFQQVRVQSMSDNEQVKAGLQKLEENTIQTEGRRKRDVISLAGVDQPFKLLQAHGINLIPMDNDATIVENAMESGQTVVLTEAGKLALNLTKSNTANMSSMKRLQLGTKKGATKKVITIRANQLMGHNNTQSITSRGPNILKRTPIDGKGTNKIFLTSIGNATTTIPTITATKTTMISPMKKSTIVQKSEPIMLHLDNAMDDVYEEITHEPITDIAELNRMLAEARREAEEYRRKLQNKEEEAELYKQQLKHLTAQKAMLK